jgi:hypothetical protein
MARSRSDKSPKKANGHGGRRAGAGRKTPEARKARADFNAATAETLAAWLPDLLRNLKRLADGGYERVEEKFEADPAVPGVLVLVERKVETAEPDRAANEYLVNRLLGKPMQAVEHTGAGGGEILHKFTVACDQFYGKPPEPS